MYDIKLLNKTIEYDVSSIKNRFYHKLIINKLIIPTTQFIANLSATFVKFFKFILKEQVILGSEIS